METWKDRIAPAKEEKPKEITFGFITKVSLVLIAVPFVLVGINSLLDFINEWTGRKR